MSGAAALLLQKDPTLTPDAVKARLMLTADKWKQPTGAADALTLSRAWLVPLALDGPSPALVVAGFATDVLDGVAARATAP